MRNPTHLLIISPPLQSSRCASKAKFEQMDSPLFKILTI